MNIFHKREFKRELAVGVPVHAYLQDRSSLHGSIPWLKFGHHILDGQHRASDLPFDPVREEDRNTQCS